MTDRRPLLVRLPESLVATIDRIGEAASARAIVRGLGRLLTEAADAADGNALDAATPPVLTDGATDTLTGCTVASDSTGCGLDDEGTSGGPA